VSGHRNLYGAQGDAYPVEDGQVWVCGPHLFVCSDLMESVLFRELLDAGMEWGGPPPTLVYTDPPWGEALAKGFRTKAGRAPTALYTWTDIYRECADLAEMFGAPLWCESSAADTRIGLQVPGVISRREGPTHRAYREITYFGGNRGGLYYAGSEPAPSVEFVRTDGFQPLRQILQWYPLGIVLDPCSGLGGVPLEAQHASWGSISNELDPHRVSKALSRMSKASGHEPRRMA
jgi:hypothetical protein